MPRNHADVPISRPRSIEGFRQPRNAVPPPSLMASTVAAQPQLEKKEPQPSARSRWLILTVVLVLLVLGGAAFFWRRYWPFERQPVIEDLQEAGDSHVTIRDFHRTYFPYPGCVLEGVVFTRGGNSPNPLITIEKLTIQSSYLKILRSHVSRITRGRHAYLYPGFGTRAALPRQTLHSRDR